MGTQLVILTKNRFAITICIGLVIFSAGTIILWCQSSSYELFQNWLNKSFNNYNYTYRGIGTNKDLWLNGYLGIFFRFKYFGYLNWIFIPLSIYFLVNITKRERWEIALWSVVTALSIFLCIKGYLNYRYQFTLFPMILSLILLFGWDVFRNRSVITRRVAFFGCVAITLVTYYALRNDYIGHLKSFVFSKEFTHPQKIVEYINHKVDLGNDGAILEYNQPFLYYYTDKKGLSYKEKKVRSFKYKYDKEKESSFRVVEKNFKVLKDEFKIKYILSDTRMEKKIQKKYTGDFYENITEYNSDLLIEDNGYKLFKLRDTFYSLTMDSFEKRRPLIEINKFNFDRIENSFTTKEIVASNNPFIKIQGIRGDFRFFPTDENNLRVKLERPLQNVNPELQFGFVDETDFGVKEDDLISVIARVRTNSSDSKTVHLFIQDKTKKWIREKADIHGTEWRDYLVVHKMRKGFTSMNIGIYWEPGSKEEWLEIASFKVYSRNYDEKTFAESL